MQFPCRWGKPFRKKRAVTLHSLLQNHRAWRRDTPSSQCRHLPSPTNQSHHRRQCDGQRIFLDHKRIRNVKMMTVGGNGQRERILLDQTKTRRRKMMRVGGHGQGRALARLETMIIQIARHWLPCPSRPCQRTSSRPSPGPAPRSPTPSPCSRSLSRPRPSSRWLRSGERQFRASRPRPRPRPRPPSSPRPGPSTRFWPLRPRPRPRPTHRMHMCGQGATGDGSHHQKIRSFKASGHSQGQDQSHREADDLVGRSHSKGNPRRRLVGKVRDGRQGQTPLVLDG